MSTNIKENHLMKQNHVLGQALLAVSDGLIVANMEEDGYPVTYVNSLILETLSTSSLDILGQPVVTILSRLISEKDFHPIIEKAFQSAEKISFEVEQGKGSDKRYFDITIRPNEKLEGVPLLLTCIINDISEKRQQQLQLMQSQKLEALGQLAGGVAHDFNNLMSIIDGYARIALQEVDPKGKAAAAMHKIMASVERGAGLTGQLLTYGRHNIVVETVIDLSEVIKEQQSLLYPLISASVELHLKLDEQLYVDCSADHINQILVNLCVNARDAMERGGKLNIHAHLVKEKPKHLKLNKDIDYVCLVVADTGCGMNAEVKSKMFDPFFTTKPNGEGTGLGLSIVYGLVQQMKGIIDVTTELGRGTTFHIYIPLSDKKPVKKVILATENIDEIRFEGYTALIVEDEDDLRDVIVSILSQTGMNIITARNGNEALAVQDEFEGDIDFLITDVVMPKLNGVRLAYLFESLRPNTKTLFMSGYPANTDTSKIALPDDAYLISKPIEYKKLIQVLAELGNVTQKSNSDAIGRMAGI